MLNLGRRTQKFGGLTCVNGRYIIFSVIKMIIKGFQKLTLLDFPGRLAATVFLGGCNMRCPVFTGGCNFRCPFCHNALLVTHQDDDEFSEEEIFAHLRLRKNVLDGVAVTGGEPLLQKDIERFLYEIKEEGYAVKLDTNGSFPEKLQGILELGLVDYVAMDIKNCPPKYGVTIGLEHYDISPVKESIELLKNSGIDYEFRTTVIEQYHSESEIRAIAQWIQGAKRWFLQQFKSSERVPNGELTAPSFQKMQEYLQIAQQIIPETELRGVG